MPTLQETFDTVVAHARKQQAKSMLRSGLSEYAKICAYRGDGGLACFAGCLIPDDRYSRDLECEIASQGKVRALFLELGYLPNFVRQLQVIHDATIVEDWEQEFKNLALAYDLNYTPLTN